MSPDLSSPALALPSIRAAAEDLARHVHRTPLVTCRSLSEAAAIELHLKCESFQRGGAFKLRGALNRTLRLTSEERGRGLIAHSSGNHAQGVALAARLTGCDALVVMPEDAPAVKVAATRGYGAEVVFAGRSSADRARRCDELRATTGRCFIPPFDDPWVICGQATVGLEIAADLPTAGAVFVPIGGGGLSSGVALATHALGAAAVVGVEATGAARMRASLDAGERVTLDRASTVADGLRPLAVGERNWEVLRQHLADVVTVTDDEIVAALRLLFERAKLVVEPSGAVAVAGALRAARDYPGPAVAVISGGNVGAGQLAGLLAG